MAHIARTMHPPNQIHFERVFRVAKAHGIGFENCKKLALEIFQKELSHLSVEELEILGRMFHVLATYWNKGKE